MKLRFFLRKFGRILIILLIIAIISAIPGWLVINLFEIKNIEIVGDNPTVVVDEKRFPKNLIFFPTKQIEMQILNDNPLINAVSITKKFPQTLVISINKRGPLARLENRGHELILTKDGVIINENQTTRLPLIALEIDQISSNGTINDIRVKKSLEFIELTKRENLQIISIREFDRESLLAKMGDSDILFPQSGEISAVVTTLQNLIAGFRIKGSMPTRIDLRFDKPVVTY